MKSHSTAWHMVEKTKIFKVLNKHNNRTEEDEKLKLY